jgi:hypothetical protein
MANIYLAARYSRHDEMKEIGDTLTMLGHTVTSRWIQGHHQLDGERHDEAHKFAREDLEDVLEADWLISFTEEISDVPVKRPSKGGRHVEFGVALIAGLRMILVGPREHVFHYLDGVEQYDDLPSLLDALAKEEAGV